MNDKTGQTTINVNRLALFPNKKLPFSCPLFVIEFLAKSLGIRFNSTSDKWTRNIPSVISAIERTLEDKSNLVDLELLKTRLPDIALFVNPEPNVEWKDKTKLMTAFWNVYKFSPRIPLQKNQNFGLKTESNLEAVDPIMVYLITLKYGIRHSTNTTLDQLHQEISSMEGRMTPLRESLIAKISRVSRKGLIDLKNHFLSDSPTGNSRCYPITPEDAIELAAKEHRWDISMSSDPIAEYRELDLNSDDIYNPVDRAWREIFNINRQYFHLNFRYMKKYDHLYNDSQRSSLIYHNGGSENSDYLILGIHPMRPLNGDVIPLTSILHDPIPEDPLLRHETIISSPDFIVSREELAEFWNTNKNFQSPHDPSKEFSKEHLQMIIVNSSPEDTLRKTIEDVREYREKIIDQGLMACLQDESLANQCLQAVLDLGMTMRGYGICYEEYPLEESSYDSKYQDPIETAVSEKVFDVIKDYAGLLLKIPLIGGRNILDGDPEVYSLRTYGCDKTLYSEIQNILRVDSIDACIRTISNYLLITTWFFLSEINDSPPFELEKLRFIS